MAGVSLQEKGWYLSDEGITQCSQNGRSDVESIIKVALDTDLREIGKGWLPEDVNRGRADYVQGPGVLQLQKIRNVSAPKDNEDSQAAPRLMKLSLTDGHTTCNAVETEVLNGISLNTAPGVKILLKKTADVEHGFLMLNNKNMKHLGGRVEKLAEGWELKRKLAKQSRSVFSGEGGPPPFVPFGQRISSDAYKPPRRDNFKSLEVHKVEKVKGGAVDDGEFEQQRKATIAEALQAKEDTQPKKFGGGTKISDQDVARITEMGFRPEDATAALKQNNGNFQSALDSLLRSGPAGRDGPGGRGFGRGGGVGRQMSNESDRGPRGRRDRRDDDGGGGGRGGRKGRDDDSGDINSKPSAPATLFDFLKTKTNIPGADTKSESKPAPKNQSDSNYRDHRERTRNNSDHSSGYDSQHNVPPRFSNKNKTDNYQDRQGQSSKGRFQDDQRSDRPRDDRPKTAPSDNRNYSDKRNSNAKNYSERSDNKGYNDRNRGGSRSESNYGDRQNDVDRRRTGAREGRGEPRGDSRQGDRRGGYSDNQKPSSANYSKPSANNNSKPTDSGSGSASQGRDKDSSRNQNYTRSDRDSRGADTRNQDRNNQSRSQNYQKGQNYPQKDNQNSQSRPSGAGRQSQMSQKSNPPQPNANYVQNYPPNSSYNYNNNAVVQSSAGPYQPQQEYIYVESQQGGPFSVRRGDKVMAKYWDDGMFYDAVVEAFVPGGPTCVVTFIEYGNSEEVLLQDIRPALPHMMSGGAAVMSVPDMRVPPPQMFYSGPPPHLAQGVPPGMEDVIQGMSSIEFRRGGGGQSYSRKDNRPQQQYYQPPASRR